MPRVTKYGAAKVQSSALPAARREAHETFESQGGPVGEAIAGFGDMAARVSGALLTEFVKEEVARKDETENLGVDKGFLDLERDMLHDPEHGFLSKRGMEPFHTRDAVLAERDKRAGLITQTATNDRTRAYAERRSLQQRASMAERMDVYASSEYKQYRTQETEALLEASRNKVIADGDRTSALEQITYQAELIERVGQDALGLGPEGRAILTGKWASETHVGAILGLLAKQHDQAALAYFAEFGDQITDGTAKASIQEKLDANSTDSLAFAAAQDIWTRLAPSPSDDDAPISIDQMEAAAAAQFKDNTRVYEKAVSYLRSRLQGVEAGRKARTDQRDDALWTAVANKVPLERVRAMPEFLAAPGTVKDKIVDEYDAERVREENRQYNLTQRAVATESLAINRQVREQNQLEIDGWAEYYRLVDPVVLRTLSRGDIQNKMPTLGREHVGRLLTAKGELEKGDAAVRSVTMDTQSFKTLAYNGGLTYINNATQTTTQKANAGKLHDAVFGAIARAQVEKNRALTYEEKETLMQTIIDQKVIVKGFWFDSDPQIAALVKPGDRANATGIPIAEARKDTAVMEEYAKLLKASLPARYATWSTASLIDNFRERFERAYGLFVMGAPSADIEAALTTTTPAAPARPPRAGAGSGGR